MARGLQGAREGYHADGQSYLGDRHHEARKAGANCASVFFVTVDVLDKRQFQRKVAQYPKEIAMLNVSTATPHQTVITTFEVTPGTAQDLLDALSDAYEHVISKSTGFVGGAIHVNDAQTRVANYSQWHRREDFQAMLRSDEMRKRNRIINEMCKSFEPVMYDVLHTFG